MAFYDQNMVPKIVENVIIDGEISEILIEKGEYSAIIINHGDHAYAKVRFDEKTLKCFEENLYKI